MENNLMPIAGLTDRGLAFPQIGVIRKGGQKSANKPGQDLTYFRVEFDASRPDLATKFAAAYSPEPRKLNVVFPFNDFDRQVTIFLEAYNKGRLVARAGTVSGLDPAQNFYKTKLDPKTGEVLARDGYWVSGPDAGKLAYYDKDKPEYVMQYTGKDGRQKSLPVFCKPITRIKFVLPELRELAYVLLKSSSIYDAINLSEQLSALWEVSNGKWAGIPMVLERKPVSILCPDEHGNKTYREKWLVHIQANPTWSEARLLGLQNQSMLLASGSSPVQMSMPALSAAIDDDDEDETIPDEPAAWVGDAQEGEFTESVPEPEFPAEPSAEEPQEKPWPFEKITKETAMSAKGVSGKTYWSMSTPELETGLNAIKDTLAKNNMTTEKREAALFNADVIAAILEYRSE
jgi:hypothetical protein